MIAFDFVYGDHFDLRYNDVYSMVKVWITSKSIWGMWLGTPCEGFTRARRGPPGPAPRCLTVCVIMITSAGCKVLNTDRAGILQRLAYHYNILGGEENPCTSFPWVLPSQLKFMQCPRVDTCIVDYVLFLWRFLQRSYPTVFLGPQTPRAPGSPPPQR